MKLSNLTTALIAGAAVVTLTAGGALAAVLDNDVTIYSKPNSAAGSKPIGTISAGQAVEVSRSASGDWCRVTGQGITGWVSCTDINGTGTAAHATGPVTPAPDTSGDQVLMTLHGSHDGSFS